MKAEYKLIEATIGDTYLKFKTSRRLFSPRYIDKSTLAMLSVVEFTGNDKVLDLGCGDSRRLTYKVLDRIGTTMKAYGLDLEYSKDEQIIKKSLSKLIRYSKSNIGVKINNSAEDILKNYIYPLPKTLSWIILLTG